MSRLLDDILYRTSPLTVVRGKCGWQDARHESVRLVGGEWFGEDSRSFECLLAPEDTCPVCDGAGQIELSAAESQLAKFDTSAETAGKPTKRPCLPCAGRGFVPGPHWPYRFPQPPPLRLKD